MHMIAQAKEGYKLSQIISDFKKYTTIEILKLLEEDNRKYIINLVQNSFYKKKDYQNQIWQRENYPVLAVSEKFLQQKIDYIYCNPIKKEYVAKPEDWIYSSARNRILNDDGVINVDDF